MAQRESGYARKERDLYPTPSWVTQALFRSVRLPQRLWEPSAGHGAISDVLIEMGFQVYASDLVAYPEAGVEERNFLLSLLPDTVVRGIVTNPPFDHAERFIERALMLMENRRGMVAMLLRVDYDSAKTRTHLFRDCPVWSRKLVLTRRIMWFEPEPGKKRMSPSENHCWYIWSWRHRGPPTIGYAP